MTKNNEKYILHGPPLYKEIEAASFGEILYSNLLRSPRKAVSMIDAETKETITYGDILKRSVLIAISLKNCGYGKESVISICSENNINFFPIIASVFYIGAVVAPLNQNYTLDELTHALHISKPQVIFCSKNASGNIVRLKRKYKFIEKVIVIDTTSLDRFIKDYCHTRVDINNFVVTQIDNVWDTVCMIMCSSGTTGLPKGVMLTHSNLNARYSQIIDPQYSLPDDTVWLGLLPFFHAYGINMSLGSVVLNKQIIIMKRFEPKMFLEAIQYYKITHLILVPPLIMFLLKNPLVAKYDLSSVKYISSGAAPLSPDTEAAVMKRFNNVSIAQGYGLTETTLGVIKGNHREYKSGSSGKVTAGTSIKVVDPETGYTLGPHQVGEICCKGVLVMKGYVNDEEATRNTIRDGWLHTGDLGYYDEEGWFYITGRLKELIKYKGFQVAPAELESILLSHPDIVDAAVSSKPDEEAGELPVGFIVKKPGSNITEKQIEDYVASKVSAQKWLRGGVYFVKEIPKNPSGKILRRELKTFFNVSSKL